MSENFIQEFALPYNQLVRLEFAENECAKFGTSAKLRLIVSVGKSLSSPKGPNFRFFLLCEIFLYFE